MQTRWGSLIWVSLSIVSLLTSSCQYVGEPTVESSQVSEPDPGSEARRIPDETLPTQVHLQASFEIPLIEGRPPSHEEMRYLLYLPAGYWQDPEERWPMILFLHGSGDEKNDSTYVMSLGLPAVLYLREEPEDFPFIVVSPQAFPGGTWWSEDTPGILNALLDEVLQTYRVDPDRVYLTGLSMGGYGAWILATAYPDRFAALVSVSGSGYRTQHMPGEDVLCRLEEVAVWGIHGLEDRISAPEASKLFAAALKTSCEGEVRWTQYEDAGHLETSEIAYRDPALYAWMLEHSR